MSDNNFTKHYPEFFFAYNPDTLCVFHENEHIFSRLFFIETSHSTSSSCKHSALFQAVSSSHVEPKPKTFPPIDTSYHFLFLPFVVATFILVKLSMHKIRLTNLFAFIRSESLHVNGWLILLGIINALVIFSLSIITLNKVFGCKGEQLAKVVELLVLFFASRWLLIGFLGWLMENRSMAMQYFQQDIGMLFWGGTILSIFLPLVLIMPFTQLVIFATTIALLFLLIIRWFYGFKLGLEEKTYGLFYFFLYFCSIEILPLVYLIKGIGVF